VRASNLRFLVNMLEEHSDRLRVIDCRALTGSPWFAEIVESVVEDHGPFDMRGTPDSLRGTVSTTYNTTADNIGMTARLSDEKRGEIAVDAIVSNKFDLFLAHFSGKDTWDLAAFNAELSPDGSIAPCDNRYRWPRPQLRSQPGIQPAVAARELDPSSRQLQHSDCRQSADTVSSQEISSCVSFRDDFD
jgi:hypothetical protein